MRLLLWIQLRFLPYSYMHSKIFLISKVDVNVSIIISLVLIIFNCCHNELENEQILSVRLYSEAFNSHTVTVCSMATAIVNGL
jgi:hypothetical protein